jgi:para-nitrobenzyl esterase
MRTQPVVSTEDGLVCGQVRDEVRVFSGLPYAAAPVGPARFAAPAPPVRWAGVRDAGMRPERAPQPQRRFGEVDMSPVLGPAGPSGGDYLTVTVTTPDELTGGLPVLVFIHGGGLTSGTGAAEVYDGAAFARHGIVTVTLNYRLGAIGWLDVAHAPANRGLLDVIAALRWVAANIASFGGNPGKVTVAGQSAGAMIVAALLAAPQARGLFARAISQSGSGLAAITREQAAATTLAASRVLGVDPTPAGFGDVADADLAALPGRLPGVAVPEGAPRDTSLAGSPYKCVIDEELLDRQPAEAVAAGSCAQVDLLIGTNREEANLYTVPGGAVTTMNQAELWAAAQRRFTDPLARIAADHQDHPGALPGETAARLMTGAFTRGSRVLTHAHARPGTARTFAYEFAWRSQAFDGRLGACHCVELPFVFGRTDLPGLAGQRSLLGPKSPPGGLADKMHDAWAAFITHGDPGWAPYRPADRTAAVIDDRWTTVTLPLPDDKEQR